MAISPLALSQQDLKYFQLLKSNEVGVLKPVEKHRLNEPLILVCCADGDQFPDIFQWHAGIMEYHGIQKRIHPLSSHGGALRIPHYSPLITPELPRDEVLFSDLEEAVQSKGFTTVALYVHAPCLVARNLNLNFLDIIRFLKEGKKRIQERIPGLHIFCFVHVDNGEKRTYFVSGSDWRKFCQHQPALAAGT